MDMKKNLKRYFGAFLAAWVSAALLLCQGTLLLTQADEADAADDAATVVSEEHLSVDPTGQSDGYSAALYDNTNGLPTSEANALAQTEEGFIWIGSYSGLIRYDGNTFERIDSTGGISSVVSLFADSKNRLWVATNDNGAAVIDNDEITKYTKADGLKSLSVRSITEDSSGNIYLATTHGIAIVSPDGKLSSLDEPQINDEYIRFVKTGAEDVVYGITLDGAVFTMKDGRLSGFYDSKKLGITGAHAIAPDPENAGYVYVGDMGSNLYYGELEKGFSGVAPVSIAPLSYTNSIEIVDDMIWFCTDKGIGYLKNGNLSIIDNIPMNSSIEDIMPDFQGNLWFTSSQQGVMKIVPNRFLDFYEKYRLENEVVYTTCMYNGKLYIGTKNNGLKIIDPLFHKRIRSIPLESSVTASGEDCGDADLFDCLGNAKIRSIIRDSKNRLWFSTFGNQGLLRFDGKSVVKFTTADGLPTDRIRTVYECSDGSFVAACTGGAAVIRDDKVTEVYDESSGISNTEVLTVCETSDGELLIGTDGDGIYVISGANTIHLGTDSGLGSDIVMRIKKDKKRDIYWIVTSNSISCMDSSKKITTIQNFPYSNNFDLYENNKDEMWVLSSNGIYVVPTEQMLANGEIQPVFYGRENGLPCITTSNSYSELTDGGDLYISGTTGIARVNIEKRSVKVSSVKMSVPYVEADGKKFYVSEDGTVTIPSDTAKLTIHGFVYNYALINPKVTYCLEGFDKHSTTVKRTDFSPLDYTNLKGGSYCFTMSLSDTQGFSSIPFSVTVIKQKAFYEMLWFRFLVTFACIALITGIFMLYYRNRTKKFIKKEQENKLLIREIVEAFAKVIDMKDKYTNGHSTRVAEYTSMLTKELGYDEETIEQYYNIALLHDIGKVGVPAEVLNKPGKLTDKEFAIIKSHSALGYNTLKNISIMPELAIGAGAHHERPDGKGYPKGLKGEEIPRVAQIIAVADTFDAMYSDRPYRKRMNFDKVVSIMKEVRGTQLEEDVVDAFLRLVDKGEFRDPNDDGGGTTEDIDNIHKRFAKQQESKK